MAPSLAPSNVPRSRPDIKEDVPPQTKEDQSTAHVDRLLKAWKRARKKQKELSQLPVQENNDSSNLPPTDPTPVSLGSMAIPSRAFIGFTSSADVASDPQETALIPPTVLPLNSNDSPSTCTGFSGATPITTNTGNTNEPPPGICLNSTTVPHYDSPNNTTEARAMIDSGARASVTNLLHLLHRVHFYTPQRPCPLRMYGATNKKVMIVPVAVGCLRVPALTLQGWVDVKTHHSPLFTSTLLNEQDLIHATGASNDYSGLTVQKCFNPTENQFQDALNGKLRFDKHCDSDTGKVVVTCHHKQVNRKDLVITGVIIFGGACTHPLTPPLLPTDHPIATHQELMNRAKVNDPAFDKLCDEETAKAMHTHRLEQLRILQDELEQLPQIDGNHPHYKLIFNDTPIHALRTKTERKLWHQRMCQFSPSITAHAHKCCKGIPEFKGDALCPV